MTRSIFDEHSCDVLLVHCIDFRFWRAINNFLGTRLNIHDYDVISLAGGAKNISNPASPDDLQTFLSNAKISEKLHHIKKIILTNHVDCGAYGGSAQFKNLEEETKFHEKQLKIAGELMKKEFPNIEVIKIFVTRRDGGVDFIVF